MKNFRFLLCCLFLLSFYQVKAAPVSEQEARKVAETFCIKKGMVGELQLSDLDRNGFYIFNNSNGGYVIVSSDDKTIPVLGYSLKGTIKSQDDNSYGLLKWLNHVEQSVDSLSLFIDDSLIDKSEWEQLKNGHYSVSPRSSNYVEPLLSTTWNQAEPFNQKCPKNSLTGCVATSMAQVMKYYNYPEAAKGITEEYVTKTKGYVVPSVILGEKYDWANMLDNYKGAYSQSEADAVSTLLYHCGVTSYMDYDSIESATTLYDAARAMYINFDYDKSIQLLEREHYSDDEWNSILKDQLNQGYPIIYSGSNADRTSGHSFICDGYDEDGFFHFNLGWGGSLDGYFSIDFIVPVNDTLNDVIQDFSFNQLMLINLFPNENGTFVYDFLFSNSEDFKISSDTLSPSQPMEVYAEFYNTGLVDFDGELFLLLRDSVGAELAVMYEDSVSVSGTGSYRLNLRFQVNGLPEGVYNLEICLRDSAGKIYKIRDKKDSIAYRKIVVDSKYETDQPEFEFIYSLPEDFKITPDSIANGGAFEVNCKFFNKGYADFAGVTWLEFQDSEGNSIMSYYLDSLELPSYSGYWFSLTMEWLPFLKDGIYRVEIKLESEGTWYKIRNAEDSISYRIIEVGKISTDLSSLSANVSRLSVWTIDNYLILSSEEKERVEVYDLLGRKVKELNVLDEVRLELPSGCYIVKSKNSAVKVVL